MQTSWINPVTVRQQRLIDDAKPRPATLDGPAANAKVREIIGQTGFGRETADPRESRAYGGDQSLKGRIELTLNIGLNNNPARSAFDVADGHLGYDPQAAKDADISTRTAIARAFFQTLGESEGLAVWHDCFTYVKLERPEGREATAIVSARLECGPYARTCLGAFIHRLAVALNQEAIAVHAVIDAQGIWNEFYELIGPKADTWLPFQPTLFIKLPRVNLYQAQAFAPAKTTLGGQRVTIV